jgi:alkyldihydroxyacetonephosphate synthase
MRRWNGWGDSATTMELPEQGTAFLHNAVGSGRVLTDAS